MNDRDEEVQEERADRLRRIALRELSRALPSCKLTNRREKVLRVCIFVYLKLKESVFTHHVCIVGGTSWMDSKNAEIR